MHFNGHHFLVLFFIKLNYRFILTHDEKLKLYVSNKKQLAKYFMTSLNWPKKLIVLSLTNQNKTLTNIFCFIVSNTLSVSGCQC